MAQARESLAEIEHVAARLKDYSGQLGASSHDTLNELHRRLENILEGHTREMNRHAESLVAGMWDRLNPSFEALGNQLVQRATAEAESRLGPYLDRVPGLIRTFPLARCRPKIACASIARGFASCPITISARRPRRQVMRSPGFATISNSREKKPPGNGMRKSVRSARALRRVWSRVPRAECRVVADDARARLQVVVEQVLATARTHCDGINSESAQKFAEEVGNRAAAHLREIQQRLEIAGSDVASRVRSSLDEAAGAAAASFGQLLQTIAGTEAEHFVDTSRNLLQECTQDLERSAQEVLGRLTSSGESSLEGFRHQLAFQVESSVAEGRSALAAELSAMLERFGSERAARDRLGAGLEPPERGSH